MSVIYGTSSNDNLIGTSSDDTTYGLDGSDRIIPGNGNDIVFGGAGNDEINGYLTGVHQYTFWNSIGNLTMYGESGDDVLVGDSGTDTLDGGSDNDEIYGQNGTDSLIGGDGNDYLDGGNENDTLDGGEGNDSLYGGDGNDRIIPGNGNDIIFGGAGNDEINGYLTGVHQYTFWNSTGNLTMYGESGDDVLVGDSGTDTLNGGSGNDEIYGQNGNDSLIGGDDNDYLDGGNGNDTLDGGDGNDSLYGGDGNDTFIIRDRYDYVYDSSGEDTANVYADFVKLPSTIEHVNYLNGAKPLPYWIDALLPNEASGLHYDTLLGSTNTFYYCFPNALPSYDTLADHAKGYTSFTSQQLARTEIALNYISGVINVQLQNTSTASQLNTITFASNAQIGTAGYAQYPSDTFSGSDVFLNDADYNKTLTDNEYGALALIHEIGHALGLEHPFSKAGSTDYSSDPPYLSLAEDTTNWTVMSYNQSVDQYLLKYSELDIAALQYIYV